MDTSFPTPVAKAHKRVVAAIAFARDAATPLKLFLTAEARLTVFPLDPEDLGINPDEVLPLLLHRLQQLLGKQAPKKRRTPR